MDKILNTLLSNSWGKNILAWMLGILVAGCTALGGYCAHLANELSNCNEHRVASEVEFRAENERILREHIDYIKEVTKRVEQIQPSQKKKI